MFKFNQRKLAKEFVNYYNFKRYEGDGMTLACIYKNKDYEFTFFFENYDVIIEHSNKDTIKNEKIHNLNKLLAQSMRMLEHHGKLKYYEISQINKILNKYKECYEDDVFVKKGNII